MPTELTPQEADQIQRAAAGARRSLLTLARDGKCRTLAACLSVVDILAVLYWKALYLDPENPGLDDRDRLVLSKATALPAQYAVMAERGFFSREDILKPDGPLCPGERGLRYLDSQPGPPGAGLSVGFGMACAARMGMHPCHVYVVAGDGELQSGALWEAAMLAGFHQTDNLTLIVDRNGLQTGGRTDERLSANPIGDKFVAFGWNPLVVDGHNPRSLMYTLSAARECTDRPSVVIANTTRGKGFALAENREDWQGRTPTEEELAGVLDHTVDA